jgi:hypothetical protein
MPLLNGSPAKGFFVMLGRDQTRKDDEAAGAYDEIVMSAAKRRLAHLQNPQPPPLGSEFLQSLFEEDHAVHDALELRIVARRHAVIERQHGAGAACEVLFQRQDLAAVTQRVLR